MSEQIAVLDGFDTSSISVSPIGPIADGRIGQLKAGSYPQFSGLEGRFGRRFKKGLKSFAKVAATGGMLHGYDNFYEGDAGMNGFQGAPLLQVSPIGPIPDGRIGQQKAQVDQYGRLIMPRVLSRINVIDASEGANYSGGSSYAPGLPLMPSSVGLAGLADADLLNFVNTPGVLPPRSRVINPSQGANYSGGASWTPGMPLISSTSGLAALEGRIGRRIKRKLKKVGKIVRKIAAPLLKFGGKLIPIPGMSVVTDSVSRVLGDPYGRAGLGYTDFGNAYGRAGLGNAYGRAGLGACACPALDGLGGPLLTVSPIGPIPDGRIGQQKAQVDQYGRLIMPRVLSRINVIDASEGANFSGGSSYAPGLPLMPSSVGLAGLAELGVVDGLDTVPLSQFKMLTPDAKKLFEKTAGVAAIKAVKKKAELGRLRKSAVEVQQAGRQLATARSVRRQLMALPAKARVNSGQLNVIIKAVADTVAREGVTSEGNPKMAALRAVILNINNAVDASPMGPNRG